MEGTPARGRGARPEAVLHLLAPAPFGGLETVVQALARGQTEAGREAHVALLVPSASDADPFARSMGGCGVELHVLEVPVRGYLRERRETGRLCRRLAPRVLHTHGYRPDVVDSGVGRALGIPTVTTVHGFIGGGWRNRLYERLQVRAFRSFDAVVAVSRPLARRLVDEGVPEHLVHTIPNAWAPAEDALDPPAARRELGVPPERFHVGFVGRLGPEKGPDVLLEALVKLRDLDWVASFIGSGRLSEGLRERARELDLADRVLWHGRLETADRLLPAFDVVVLPSRTEGTPLVLLEAMHRGVPVVATGVGGVPDVVGPDTALLVEPEAPELLAGAIRSVVEDREAAHRRAEKARAQLGTAPAWIREYEDVYRQASHRRAVPSGTAGGPWNG